MADQRDIDAAKLERDVAEIKDAMGISERYPGQIRLWLVFALLVGVASGASQLIQLNDYQSFWHPVVWFGLLGGGGFLLSWHDSGAQRSHSGPLKPDIWLQFLCIYLAFIPVQILIGPYLDGVSSGSMSLLIFSLAILFVGVAYLVLGNTLKAYAIQRRDRIPFYVGGLWMIALGTVMPHVEVLETWGYATFGGLYVLYAVGTYLVLSRTDSDGPR